MLKSYTDNSRKDHTPALNSFICKYAYKYTQGNSVWQPENKELFGHMICFLTFNISKDNGRSYAFYMLSLIFL